MQLKFRLFYSYFRNVLVAKNLPPLFHFFKTNKDPNNSHRSTFSSSSRALNLQTPQCVFIRNIHALECGCYMEIFFLLKIRYQQTVRFSIIFSTFMLILYSTRFNCFNFLFFSFRNF